MWEVKLVIDDFILDIMLSLEFVKFIRFLEFWLDLFILFLGKRRFLIRVVLFIKKIYNYISV